eukprot:UN27102
MADFWLIQRKSYGYPYPKWLIFGWLILKKNHRVTPI